MQASLELALQRPRDEMKAADRIYQMCRQPAFASMALYSYRRGGSLVEGESVNLSREIERCWGNIMSGFRIVSRDREWVHIQGRAHDLESNTVKVQESRVPLLIQRRDKETGETRWIATDDEREIRERVNKEGALLERNCVLRVIPAYIKSEARSICKQTMRGAADGELSADRESVLRKMLRQFGEVGVTAADIERLFGHPVGAVTADELAELRRIYATISGDANMTPDHFFRGSSMGPVNPKQGDTRTRDGHDEQFFEGVGWVGLGVRSGSEAESANGIEPEPQEANAASDDLILDFGEESAEGEAF